MVAGNFQAQPAAVEMGTDTVGLVAGHFVQVAVVVGLAHMAAAARELESEVPVAGRPEPVVAASAVGSLSGASAAALVLEPELASAAEPFVIAAYCWP